MKAIRIYDLKYGTSVLAFDLRDILAALGPKAINAAWSVGRVEGGQPDGLDVTGGAADELEKLAQSGIRIGGEHFVELARNVRQVIWGRFEGYDTASSASPWIVVIAFDSAWFEVQSTDDAILSRLMVAFKDVRPVA